MEKEYHQGDGLTMTDLGLSWRVVGSTARVISSWGAKLVPVVLAR